MTAATATADDAVNNDNVDVRTVQEQSHTDKVSPGVEKGSININIMRSDRGQTRQQLSMYWLDPAHPRPQ